MDHRIVCYLVGDASVSPPVVAMRGPGYKVFLGTRCWHGRAEKGYKGGSLMLGSIGKRKAASTRHICGFPRERSQGGKAGPCTLLQG